MTGWAALIVWHTVGVALDLIGATMRTTMESTTGKCHPEDHPAMVRIMAGMWKCRVCGGIERYGDADDVPESVKRKRRGLSRWTTFGAGGEQ